MPQNVLGLRYFVLGIFRIWRRKGNMSGRWDSWGIAADSGRANGKNAALYVRGRRVNVLDVFFDFLDDRIPRDCHPAAFFGGKVHLSLFEGIPYRRRAMSP